MNNGTNFESNGYKYFIDRFGVITQIDPEPFKYDDKYVSTYDSEAYRRQSEILQALRLGFVLASHGRPITSILDVGYGNGAFMLFAKQAIPYVTSYDITGIEVEGCRVVSEFEPATVITFWDSLEHFHDISFLSSLEAETICISLPYCHYYALGQKWFDNDYHHRKPNEHIRHFTPDSLESTMRHHGWVKVAISHHEDIVRKSKGAVPNILSMAFKKR